MTRGLLPRVLNRVRARAGAPTVQFTPPSVRGGNILYYWQWAFLGRDLEHRRSVLRTDHMAAWLAEFPILGELTIEREVVRLFDQRTFSTRHHFGTSFTTEENRRFGRWLLSNSPSFMARVERAQETVSEQTCVLNVRRGDYYSVPEYRAEFAMDIRAHISQAIELLKALQRPAEDLLIVSDDPEWCATHLREVLPAEPRFVTNRRSIFDDLAVLVASRTLVLANSTFSYWGSHLASALHDDHLAIAPPFHQRVSSGSFVSDLFDPEWPRTTMAIDPGGPL